MTADLTITRAFAAPVARVFEHITRPDLLAQWWGPEGIVAVEGQLDFTAPGPYDSTMINAQGQRFRVSGQVTSVVPGRRIAFTWAWHDADGQRGAESFVALDLAATRDGGTRLILTHGQLPNDAIRDSHESGWRSSLRRLVAQVDG
jgi:uncharacterized protein YndB with AHSA1/START domain